MIPLKSLFPCFHYNAPARPDNNIENATTDNMRRTPATIPTEPKIHEPMVAPLALS